MKKVVTILLVMLMMTVSTVGCSTAQSTDTSQTSETQSPDQEMQQEGGTLVISLNKDPVTLNPLFSNDVSDEDMIYYLYAPLYETNSVGEIECVIAKELPEVSEDNLSITIKIKEGWKWHDGEELTADDIKFSIDTILNPEANSTKRKLFAAINNVEILDDYSVKINMADIDSQILRQFYSDTVSRFVIPQHIFGNIPVADIETSEYSTHPVASGYFKLASWDMSERLVLKNNNEYLLGKAKLDEIVVEIIPSVATAVLKLESGELSVLGIGSSEVERLKQNDNLEVATYSYYGFDCIQYNLQIPQFEDKNVRQAIAYAINKDAIINGIYQGAASPATTSYQEGLWCFNENVKRYNYDKLKAELLLDEAGWVKASDGYRYKDGISLEFDLATTKGNETREKLVVYFQNVLKEVGIKANPRIMESNTLFDNMDNYDFDAVLLSYSIGDTIVQSRYYTEGAIFNSGQYKSERIEELFGLIQATFDREEQKQYANEIQDILAEDQPFTYFVNRVLNVAYNKNVKGAQFIDLQGWSNIQDWYIEE
jgi:peptide/nickel transport system substrate-binding protein